MSALPNELWMLVFESLDSPSDLAKVSLTSKLFRSLAIYVLHRNLIWNDPRHFAHGLHLWTSSPSILTAPRTLTVGISQAPSTQVDRLEYAAVVAMDGTPAHVLPVAPSSTITVFSATPRIRPSFFACQQLYHAMTAQIVTFTQLNTLVFKKAILPANIYQIIHDIPSLRVLHIEFCTFDSVTPDRSWDYTVLPITELSLMGLDGSNLAGKSIFLTKAHNLRVLRFDSTAFCIFKVFTTFNPAGIHIPPQYLESIDAHLPEQKYWPSNQQEGQRLYTVPFVALLAMCSSVIHLSIHNYIPEFQLPDNTLPNLRSYNGPMSTVVTVAGHRPLVRLEIRDAGTKLSEFIDTLTSVGEGHSSLQELSANVPKWDDEILYAVSQLFPNLRKLDIRYGHARPGCPSEDFILSIGPQFIARTPYMHTLYIFSTQDRPAAELLVPKRFDPAIQSPDFSGENLDAEAELKGLIQCWDRYCPQLREVQLLHGFVWRKAHVRPGMRSTGWGKRPYRLVNGERDYGCY